MRKLSLILAILMALCSCAFAETEDAAFAAEDILGQWNLEYAVAEGIQMKARDYGLTIILTIHEDGTALLDYGDGTSVEMTWSIEENAALTTVGTGDVMEMTITEEGFLDAEDEIGKMRFSRPEEEAKAK